MIQGFEYTRPSTIKEIVHLLEIGAKLLAGGTDLLSLLKNEVKSVRLLADLQGIPQLRGIKQLDGVVFVGAMTRLMDLAKSDIICNRFPSVASAARCVASPQIRNIATIGGNLMQDRRCLYFNQSFEWRSTLECCYKTGGSICHQAPGSKICRAPFYSDVATALVACDASACVWERGRRRELPLEELCRMHADINGTTAHEPLFLEYISLSLQSSWNSFIKESIRQSIDFPIFNAAVGVGGTESVKKVRIVAGAVAPNPILLEETSKQAVSGTDLDKLCSIAYEEIKKKSMFVREIGISMKNKQESVQSIRRLIKGLNVYLLS